MTELRDDKTAACMTAWERLTDDEKMRIRRAFVPLVQRFSRIGYREMVELAGKLGMWLKEKEL